MSDYISSGIIRHPIQESNKMSKVKFDLPAGVKVKDKVACVEGIITSRIERINGCLQYYIETAYGEDGKRISAGYSDIEDLEILDWNGKSKKKESVSFSINKTIICFPLLRVYPVAVNT